MGKDNFKNIYKARERETIENIIWITQPFPRFVEEGDTKELMEEVSQDELKEVLHRFQKDKSPRPDGWRVDLFLEIFYILGEDLLKAVEETRSKGRTLENFKSTFIALISKVDNSNSFDNFKLISLTNII